MYKTIAIVLLVGYILTSGSLNMTTDYCEGNAVFERE